MYNLYQKNLPSIAWLAVFHLGQWLAGVLFPSCLRDTSIAITHLPSGTAALFEEGFFPHYTFSVGFSTTRSASSALSAETLLTEGWCSTFFAYLMWQSNKVLRTTKIRFFFLIKVLTRHLCLAHHLSQKSIFQQVYLYRKEQSCKLAIHWQLNLPLWLTY